MASEPGRGSTFTIRLPRTVDAPKEAVHRRGGAKTSLVEIGAIPAALAKAQAELINPEKDNRDFLTAREPASVPLCTVVERP